MTNTEALKEVYNALGGNDALEGASNLDVLNAIAELNGGTAQDSNAKAIKEIADNPPSGGGGSSDFSTATVTFINSGAEGTMYRVVGIPIVYNDPDYGEGIYSFNGEVYGGSPSTLSVPLYKGRCNLLLSAIKDADLSVMPSWTGGVAVDQSYTFLIITGDGTFTAAGTGGN